MDLMASLYQMFFGDDFSMFRLFETIFRVLFLYIYTLINLRFMDKRSFGQLTLLEVIVVIALGQLVGNPMIQHQIPLIYAMLVITLLVSIEKIISKLAVRHKKFEKMINGQPVVLIKNGKLLRDAMRQENFSENELLSVLRIHGIKKLSEIKIAYLETSGKVSILTKDKKVDETDDIDSTGTL